MVDEDKVATLRAVLCDRFTAEELVELLDIGPGVLFDRFADEFMELNMDDIL